MKHPDEMNLGFAARRCLFGQPDTIRNLSELITMRKIEEERSKVAWDFDFRSGCPVLAGSTRGRKVRHEWTIISADEVEHMPDVYKQQVKRFQMMLGGNVVEATTVGNDLDSPHGKISTTSPFRNGCPRTKRSRTVREKVLKKMTKLSNVDERQQKKKRIEAAVVRDISKIKKDVCKYSKSRTSSYCKKIMSCSTPTRILKSRLQKRRTATAPPRRMSGICCENFIFVEVQCIRIIARNRSRPIFNNLIDCKVSLFYWDCVASAIFKSAHWGTQALPRCICTYRLIICKDYKYVGLCLILGVWPLVLIIFILLKNLW